ncbi:MAG: Prolipoprotein diacylglyceryl transferase [Phycisphaerae bacterium]|nr:Prolipoprotein diacylglyceryl transferase [Phycisphaerae bacterium]
MLPYIVRCGNLHVAAYPFMYGLGIAVGFLIALTVAVRLEMDWKRLIHLLPCLTISIVLGGAIAYRLQFGHTSVDFFDGGQTLYGAIVCSIPVIVVYCIFNHLYLPRVLDALSVGATIGIALGRVGCFCRGCCEGTTTLGSFGVSYPLHIDLSGRVVGPPTVLSQIANGQLGPDAIRSLPVVPVQLYEALVSVLIFIVLIGMRGVWANKPGLAALGFLGIYSTWRFFIEFYRVEPLVFLRLTASQIMSVVLVVCVGAFLAHSICRSGDISWFFASASDVRERQSRSRTLITARRHRRKGLRCRS